MIFMAVIETYYCSLHYRTVSCGLMAPPRSCKHTHLRVWSRNWPSPAASLSIPQNHDRDPSFRTGSLDRRSLAACTLLGYRDSSSRWCARWILAACPVFSNIVRCHTEIQPSLCHCHRRRKSPMTGSVSFSVETSDLGSRPENLVSSAYAFARHARFLHHLL